VGVYGAFPGELVQVVDFPVELAVSGDVEEVVSAPLGLRRRYALVRSAVMQAPSSQVSISLSKDKKKEEKFLT